jgi:hypothetical protein
MTGIAINYRLHRKNTLKIAEYFIDQSKAADGRIADARFVVVEKKGVNGCLIDCRNAVNSVAVGGYIALLIRFDGMSQLKKMLSFSLLPFRIMHLKRTLALCGASRPRVYGISPDIDSPTIIFPLKGAAAKYAEDKLLPKPPGAASVFRKALSCWAGCDVSIGAILAIGKKHDSRNTGTDSRSGT